MGFILNLNNCAKSLLQDIQEWKNKIAAAITDKGGQATPDSSFDELAEDIATIPDFKLDGWTFVDDYNPTTVEDFLNNIGNVISINDDKFTSLQRDYLFYYCESLTTVAMSNLNHIDANNTFSYAKSLGSFEAPELININGSDTFNRCAALTTVNLPALTTISDNSTFYYCSALTTVDLPALLYIHGSNTFSYCFALTTVDLPALTTISDEQTFLNCTTLTTVNMSSLTVITGMMTFSGCYALTTVTFGTLISLEEPFSFNKENLRNITVGIGTNINLPFQYWKAANVIAEGQSGIDELNSNLYNNLLTKLYDHSQDGETRTLRIGWLANVSPENITYANSKGWTLTT